MNNFTSPDSLRVNPQLTQQTQSRNLASQASFYSQKFHHFSNVVADLNMQNQEILQQRELVNRALRETLIKIQTIREEIAGLITPTVHRETAALAFNRLQIIYQAQRAVEVLSIESATLNAKIAYLTERSSEVFSRLLQAQQNKEQVRNLALQFHNMHTTYLKEIQERAQAPRPFIQTDAAAAAPAAKRALVSVDRQTTAAIVPRPPAHLESECEEAQATSLQTTGRKAFTSDELSLADELERLLAKSQKQGYTPTYSPLMCAVLRVIETEEPAALITATTSLIKEIYKKGRLHKRSDDEDIASCLATGLKIKKIGIGPESDFFRLYEEKIKDLRAFGSRAEQAHTRKTDQFYNEKKSKKKIIINFLIGHNRLDLLPEKLDLLLIQSALRRGRQKIKYNHKGPDDSGGSKKIKMSHLQPELTKKLKALLALSQQKDYQPKMSDFLQAVRDVASATTAEEFSASTHVLEEQICKLKMVTKKNMSQERLKLVAPNLQKVKEYTSTNKEDFLRQYQQKIEELEQLNIKSKDTSSMRDRKKLDLRARQVHYMIFQLLIAQDRLDLIPADDIYLPRLFLNLFITIQAQGESRRKKRKAADMTS